MNCDYIDGSSCEVAARLTDVPITTRTDAACKVCLGLKKPAAVNRVTISLAISSTRRIDPEMAKEITITFQDELTVTNKPTLTDQIWDISKAVIGFVADGFKFVNKETYTDRLNTCNICPLRRNTRCGLCNCFIVALAKLQSNACKNGSWLR